MARSASRGGTAVQSSGRHRPLARSHPLGYLGRIPRPRWLARRLAGCATRRSEPSRRGEHHHAVWGPSEKAPWHDAKDMSAPPQNRGRGREVSWLSPPPIRSQFGAVLTRPETPEYDLFFVWPRGPPVPKIPPLTTTDWVIRQGRLSPKGRQCLLGHRSDARTRVPAVRATGPNRQDPTTNQAELSLRNRRFPGLWSQLADTRDTIRIQDTGYVSRIWSRSTEPSLLFTFPLVGKVNVARVGPAWGIGRDSQP